MKYAEYIKSIEITALWGKRKHIMWNLDRSVNILSGINGVGKSTILSKIIHSIGDGGALKIESSPSAKVTLVPEDATHIRYNVIRSLDSPVLDLGTMAHVDSRITSALDFQLYHLQRKYLDYQVKVGNKIIEELQQGNAGAAMRFVLTKWARYSCLTSCRAVRSRFLQYCLLYWWRTKSLMFFLWMSPKSACT